MKLKDFADLIIILGTFVMVYVILANTMKLSNERNYTLAPKDTVFVMYTEKCSCGAIKEVEYSYVSDLGFSHCENCKSSYEFSLKK